MIGGGIIGPLQEALSGAVGITETELMEEEILGLVVTTIGFVDGFLVDLRIGFNVTTVGSLVSMVGSWLGSDEGR